VCGVCGGFGAAGLGGIDCRLRTSPLDVRQKILAPASMILYPVSHHTGLARTTEEDV